MVAPARADAFPWSLPLARTLPWTPLKWTLPGARSSILKNRKSGPFSPNRHSGWVPDLLALPSRGAIAAVLRQPGALRPLEWRAWRPRRCGRRFLPEMKLFSAGPSRLDPIATKHTSLTVAGIFQMNLFKTTLLMSLLMGLFLVVGALIGGSVGMVIAFLFAAGLNLLAYWNSDRMLLSMYGARQVDAASAPDLFHIVARLAAQAHIPMPKVFISENPQPNAFATGRNPQHAAVCVTSGLLAQVNNEELAGVIAH